MAHFKRGGFASPELETTNNGYLAVDLFLALSGYATAMLMAGMRPAFCAILKAYSKRIDGEQNGIGMLRLEKALSSLEPLQNKWKSS
jgi:hypothetical protein